jgi:hypothetical protein
MEHIDRLTDNNLLNRYTGWKLYIHHIPQDKDHKHQYHIGINLVVNRHRLHLQELCFQCIHLHRMVYHSLHMSHIEDLDMVDSQWGVGNFGYNLRDTVRRDLLL